MTDSFAHPLLGKLVPKSSDGIVQFLGIKYASLKDRLATPEISNPNVEVTDATSYGPSVMTLPVGCDLEFQVIQQSLPKVEFSSSELEGLNLNITAPSNLTAGQKLPVFVFIHGGGFGIGGNSWPQYDLKKFVQLSVKQNQPVIGININYRLGVFGFLTSEELRNAGYAANNGLRDQRVAFEWIKKYIGGFGGDPDNITVGGESAGGVSTTLHLYSKQPLFTRAISMGGTALLMKPLPLFVHEMTYQAVLQSLGITATTAAERVQALLAVPIEEMMSKLPNGLPLQPAVDGDIIPIPAAFKDIGNLESSVVPGKQWCKALLIGDNQLDGSIFASMLESREGGLVTPFVTSMTKHLESYPGVAKKLLDSYGITGSMTDSEALHPILNFITDIGFLVPTLTYARGWPGTAHVYLFNEPNPWEGRFKGYTSHVLEVAFLFQNFNDALSAVQVQSAVNFAADVIKFVNGQEPWDKFSQKDYQMRVYGPSEGADEALLLQVAGKVDRRTKRRPTIFQFSPDPGYDVISTAFGMFLAGQ